MKKGLLIVAAVLLALTLAQGWELHALRRQTAEMQDRIAENAGRVHKRRPVLLEDPPPSEGPPRTVRFQNARIVPEARVLFVDLVVESPQKELPSQEVGLCLAGEPYSLAWQRAYLSRETDGTYTETLSFPLDEDMELDIRLSDDTVLFSGSVGMLLPLRRDHGGGIWHFDENRQIFYILDLSASLINPEGKEVPVRDGTFCFYRNGERVLSAREIENDCRVDIDGELTDSISFPCKPGDHIRLDYTCRDETGLGWEFPLMEMEALEWGDMRRCPLSGWPVLIWPE